jgi:hypothetical protein
MSGLAVKTSSLFICSKCQRRRKKVFFDKNFIGVVREAVDTAARKLKMRANKRVNVLFFKNVCHCFLTPLRNIFAQSWNRQEHVVW